MIFLVVAFSTNTLFNFGSSCLLVLHWQWALSSSYLKCEEVDVLDEFLILGMPSFFFSFGRRAMYFVSSACCHCHLGVGVMLHQILKFRFDN